MFSRIYGSKNSQSTGSISDLQQVLETIAQDTDTRDLVVVLYLLPNSRWTGGTAYCRSWLSPTDFITRRGKWHISADFDLPADLPLRFKLIRMLLRTRVNYPLFERDRYGWEFNYTSFKDHLALLFAHELHHFRRYHLGLHPHEGEKSANRWALQQAQKLGFGVAGRQRPIVPRRTKIILPQPLELVNPNTLRALGQAALATLQKILGPTPRMASKKLLRQQAPHFERLRQLKPGSEVTIVYDPSKKYQDQKARLVRSMRRNSVRIVIETVDGKKWRWPMAWLEA